MNVLKHVITGGIVKPLFDDEQNYKFDSIKLKSTTTDKPMVVKLEELEERFVAYVSPEQEEIQKLKAIIERQNQEIQKLMMPAERKRSVHLSKEQVKEIKEAIDKGADLYLLAKEYSVSITTIKSIKYGKHVKL